MDANPKAIPGAEMLYTIQSSNQGKGWTDTDTVILSETIPANMDLFVGDIGDPGLGPVVFIDGFPASGLSYTFPSDLEFSSNNGSTWYTPIPGGDYNSEVTNIRILPKGQFNGSDGINHPLYEIRFKMRIQ